MMNNTMNGHNVNGHSAHQVNGRGIQMCRFFGSTNREAMRQVRLALGSEALIVSNRRVNGGVEILATEASKIADDAPVVTVQPPAAAHSTAYATAHPSTTPHSSAHPADVMDAITALRGEFEHRMEDLVWNQQIKQAPQALSLFQTLLGVGFSTPLLRAMLKRLPSDASDKAALAWARQELIRHLPACIDENALWRPGLALALVGPTGVGKTTTLAKLAARAVRRFGPQQVALLTTDTYRIGACEQLKIYGQILRVPVHVAHDAGELRRIVQNLAADHVLLIDNVGVSQRDSAVQAQAAMLREAGRAVARLLVLNAASHGDTLEEVAHTYRNDGGTPLAGCILSKCDEAPRLASALDTVIRHQLPIHYVSNGQKVPEHLSCPSPQDLVDQALAATPSGKTLYAPNRADLAALMALPSADAQQDEQRRLCGLLALSHPTGSTLAPDVVQQACREIDAQSVCAQAFVQWQTHRHQDLQAAPAPLNPGEHAQTLLTAAYSACAQAPASAHLVAIHDHAGVAAMQQERGQGQGQGRLSWVQLACASDDGAFSVLSSPLQSLQFANVWTSSCGASALSAMNATQTRLQQVQWLQTQVQTHASEHRAVDVPDSAAERLPTLHVLDGGSNTLWRALARLDVAWMASCAPSTVVVHADTPTRTGALARHAAYRMLDTTHWQHSLQTCAGRSFAQVTVWLATDDVALRQRGQAALPLRLIHIRLQDRRDGSLVQQWSALSHTASSNTPLNDAELAHILLARMEQKWMARAVQAFWRRLMPETQSTQPTQSAWADARQDAGQVLGHQHAALAVHMGLAVWQIVQSDQTRATRQLLQSLSTSSKPSVNRIASALPRVFALKDMLGCAPD